MSNIISLNIDNQSLTELSGDGDLKSIIVAYDEGYQPIIEFRDILINKLGFQLETEYGITDMTQIFNYQNKKYELKYYSEDDMIFFETNVKDESQLNFFRTVAAYLKKENISKKENGNFTK